MDITVPNLDSFAPAPVVDILAREKQRCNALLLADHTALNDLLSDDLVHIHATAKVEEKAAYIGAVGSRMKFLTISRSNLRIRIYGDTAVMTGTVDQSLRLEGRESIRTMTAIATQVWVMQNGCWKQCLFQLTEPR